jgi:uncharacterized protein
MILVKVHPGVVAICDAGLIGKRFEEGERVLEVSERFYKGAEKTVDEVRKILRTAENLNLVGEETIALAIEEKVINADDLIRIQGVPHAQVYHCLGQ